MRQLLAIVLLLSVIGCSKDKENDPGKLIPETGGIYKGTFQRKTASGGAIVSVTLDLTGNTFSGQPATPGRYPVIGRGSYTINDNKINFVDSLYYTADFDWTLILYREYELAKQGDSITFTRNYNNHAWDIYKLKRQQ
ncbi:hypothetical protein D3H65_02685 [Paraflavitalea soli]|uniref:Lipocalin-like domain-containing protein n=1 Tax=Paraflavitalea soli TaxID=2315862 RepID=A0A3B7MF16_9BACT|nr:hypothetical protein [Paraflavitalea soli]AXY72938.1 hypothetical protein D3H65_02685 [Paraflavitalea soli]